MTIPQAHSHSPTRPADRPASPCPSYATPADHIDQLSAEIERLMERLADLKWQRRNLLIGAANRRRFRDDPAFVAKFSAAREAAGSIKRKLPTMTREQHQLYRKLRYKNGFSRADAEREALA